MQPDDPRHGTNAGHVEHMSTRTPLCVPCKRAKLRYDKQRRLDLLNGLERSVPMWRVRRRVEALQFLGHPLADINKAGGLPARKLHSVLFADHHHVYTATFEGVDQAFRTLSMKLGRDKRVANLARRKGYLPPLAWDDIDDPDEWPRTDNVVDSKDIDTVVVERLMAGESVRATRAEKDEAMRRWKAMGRSERSLCETHGWKDSRYGRSVA